MLRGSNRKNRHGPVSVHAPDAAPSRDKLTAADGKPYWEMIDKEGQRYLFGQTTVSRIADPADVSKIFKLCLDRVVDRDGNYMKVTYVADQGQGYLSEIRYVGYTTKVWKAAVRLLQPPSMSKPALLLLRVGTIH